ncbi:CU044_5270 family protein [Actinoallomurus soli]|uniref:CU044_5270 family protein n=1 Tax=Actinoallomurus soli TaxID=2952535 RepID=UPI0020935DA6|nr:CU044_5270 family protein [Actinoallomurus soli]MCO5973847.1 CU044_5270 family protein [Actinoallomurus soli]
MDEMSMLRDHHDAQPAPSPAAVRAARARLAARARSRRRAVPHLGRLSLGIGALGVAACTGLVVVQATGDGEHGRTLNAVPAAAVQVLDRAATAARRQPDPRPRADQYVFAESLDGGYASGPGYAPRWQDMRRRIWLPVDGRREGLLRERRTAGGGSTTGGWTTTALKQPGGGPLGDPNNYTSLDRLSRDPGKLLAQLHQRYPAQHSADPARDRSADEQVFDGIRGMVAESYLPPSLRAALFQATKRIKGITLVGDSTDAAGRHGVAVALTFREGIREEIIFDRRTYAPLGSRTVLADAAAYHRLFADLKGVPQGRTLSAAALLSTRIVDGPGRLT